MSENKTSIIPDVITPVSEAIQSNIPETAKQTDGALSTVVGFFNNVVLYPVKKANITFKYKLEAFEEDLKEKIKNIPEENIQVPPTMIAGPTLEALRYTYDEMELREMYENLLASAMDNRKVTQTHPAFVDTIRQMSPLDAVVLQKITDMSRLRCGEIVFQVLDTTQVYSKAMPNYFVEELAELADPFEVSTSLVNLQRLGLIKIADGELTGMSYEEMKEHPYVLERKAIFEQFGRAFTCEVHRHAIVMNNYGEQFARVCLQKDI